MIVDDHASFRVSARALLHEGGYEVIGEAVDGRSGITMVSRTQPDVVLLDVQLPDGNGFDLAGRVTEAAPAAKVVLISSREAGDYRSRLAATAAPFIAKHDLSLAALSRALEA